MRTLLAFLILSGVGVAQSSRGYVVQKYAGQTVLVPLGPIKTGPRSYSQFDPANPYRVQNQATPRAQSRPLTIRILGGAPAKSPIVRDKK